MADHPALFSAPMVRANRAGLKWQTRRIIKPRKCPDSGVVLAPCEIAGEIAQGDYRLSLYGKPGDTIWVRETWAPFDEKTVRDKDRSMIFYRADDPRRLETDGPWKPSIHMPRWASRDSYIITDVRAERLQDITEEDARAEGVQLTDEWTGAAEDLSGSYVAAYRILWDTINGPGSWARNPWVWVYTYDNPACKEVQRG